MNFGQAIEEMKRSRLCRRAGWNGKGMHVYLEDEHRYKIREGVYKGTERSYNAHFVMFTAQGTHQPGWVASQADMLAEDWEVVETNP